MNIEHKIPILMPVFGNLEYTQKAVASLIKHTDPNLFECLIIDNGSTDDTPTYLKWLVSTHPQNFRVVTLEKNLGFGGGLNRGFDLISSLQWEYVVVANNDLIFTPKWLENMLETMTTSKIPKLGIVGPMSNFAGGSQGMQANYRTIEDLDAFATAHHEQNKGRNHEAGVVVGLLMLISRGFFDEVGTFDERFFPGTWEENDLELRGALKGWRYVVDESTFIHHFGSKTIATVEASKNQRKNFLVNRDRFRAKWTAADSPWEGLSRERYIARGQDPDQFKQADGKHRKWVVAACRVKNGAPWMERTLTRVSEFADEIVILVDQASTDNTEEICSKFPKIVAIEKEPPHPYSEAWSRNRVLNMAFDRQPDWIYCFTKDQLVRARGGYKPISEVEVGDEVLTHSGNYYKVTKLHRHKHTGQIAELRIEGQGLPVTCTPEHRFFAIKGGDCVRGLKRCTIGHKGWVYKTEEGSQYSQAATCTEAWAGYKADWVEAKDLTEKDFVTFPISWIGNESKVELLFKGRIRKGTWKDIEKRVVVDESAARLFGLYMAEGFVSHGNGVINFAFHEKETEYHNFVIQKMAELFGVKGRIRRFKNSKGINVCFTAKWLGLEFERYFGRGALNKTVPDEFMHLSAASKLALFAGWCQGDGNWQSTYYQITSISRNLSLKMRELLLGAGVFSTYHICKKRNPKHHDAYILRVNGDDLDALQGLDKHIERRASVVDKDRNKNGHFFFEQDGRKFLAVPVKSVTLANFDDDVFNLSVEEEHTYTVGQVGVHNCFDADEVIEKRAVERRSELTDPADPSVMMWIQPIVQLWNSENMQRVDGLWGTFYQGRMFRVLPGQKIENSNNLIHCGSTPFVPQDRHGFSYMRIVHYGNVDSTIREAKYAWYTKTDTDKDLGMALGAWKEYYWRLYYGHPEPNYTGPWRVIEDDKEWGRPPYGCFYKRDVYRHVKEETGMILVPFEENPTISLCMLVKDEAGLLPRAISSVRSFINEVIVIDTGSVDGSDHVAERMGAKVFYFDWKDDFSAARNFCLSKATGDWILRIDPDEVVPWETAINLPMLVRDRKMEGFVFPIINWLEDPQSKAGASWALSETCRLYRNQYPTIHYTNPVHEELDDSFNQLAEKRIGALIAEGMPADQAKETGKVQVAKVPFQMLHYGYLRGREFSDKKFNYYYELGKKHIEAKPKDSRPYFNTAVHLLHIKKYKEAAEQYLKALELDPRLHMAWNDLAVIQMTVTGDLGKAEEYFQKSLSCMDANTHQEHRNRVEKNMEEVRVRILSRVLAV